MNNTATVFINVNVFDGTGADMFAGQVLVRGERIAVVARAGEAPLSSENCRVIDGHWATLMPGMVEGHAHLTWPKSGSPPA